ncbi:MAG: UDP-glucose/GDP-mannose dehydrogenase family protein [Symploca sp. SIO2C1]|nr:UDP-glucose/GDP-mannose dehydrogenase family protein [Symploca sp. SIO2C1]
MRVCVIGTGYVGLVTGACLAYIGHHVICVDNNEVKIALMQSGKSPIYEPGLSAIMQSTMKSGKLEFTKDFQAGINHGQVIFIAVDTPPLPKGESDTRYIQAVACGIGAHLNSGYKVIVNKSTVPIGSGDWVYQLILDKLAEHQEEVNTEFDIVSNPEFLREGLAVYDTFNPERIILGSNSKQAITIMQELYAPIIERQIAADPTLPPVNVLITDLNSAEVIHYAANASLATKISFINEVANICDRVGANVNHVAKGIGLDSWIGNKLLQAGMGWGGSYFPKDLSALINIADDYGYDAQLLQATVGKNQHQCLVVVEKLQQALETLKDKNIGLLGLTFNPYTDNMCDTSILELIEQLSQLDAKIKAYDPIVAYASKDPMPVNVTIVTEPEQLAHDCDALVLVTDWLQFYNLDYAKLAKLMKTPVLIDGRNFLDPEILTEAGFYYITTGPPTAASTLLAKLLQRIVPSYSLQIHSRDKSSRWRVSRSSGRSGGSKNYQISFDLLPFSTL